jgi:hypothetical protein
MTFEKGIGNSKIQNQIQRQIKLTAQIRMYADHSNSDVH